MDKRIIFVLIILVAIIGIFFSLTNGFNFENSNVKYTHDFDGVKFNIPENFVEDIDAEKELYYDDLEVNDGSLNLRIFSESNGDNSIAIFFSDLKKSQEKNSIKDYIDNYGIDPTSKSVNGKNCLVINDNGLYMYNYETNAKFVSVWSENETLINEIIV